MWKIPQLKQVYSLISNSFLLLLKIQEYFGLLTAIYSINYSKITTILFSISFIYNFTLSLCQLMRSSKRLSIYSRYWGRLILIRKLTSSDYISKIMVSRNNAALLKNLTSWRNIYIAELTHSLIASLALISVLINEDNFFEDILILIYLYL